MVSLQKFKDYLLRKELGKLGFTPVESIVSTCYIKGPLHICYDGNLLVSASVDGVDIGSIVKLLPPDDDGKDDLYYCITDEAIEWLYDTFLVEEAMEA